MKEISNTKKNFFSTLLFMDRASHTTSAGQKDVNTPELSWIMWMSFLSSLIRFKLGIIVLLTEFCCWFCNSSNMVCFHHFVAYASKNPSCYQWMDSGYSLYLDHVFIWIFNRCKSLRYYYSSLNSRQTSQACQSFSR